MNRRKFVLTSGLLASTTVLPNGTLEAQLLSNDLPNVMPSALQKGDVVGLITPGSPLNNEAFDKVKTNMESLGFQVKYSENYNQRKGFLAGTDQQRLDDIHAMFADDEVKGIICGRGGYGTGRLLQGLDYDLISANPKVFVGFSDITALLYAIYKKTGLVCFHGPVGASEFTDFTTKGFEQVVMKGKSSVNYKRPKEWKNKNASAYQADTIVSGEAEGKLVGGNLSLMCSLLGTPYDLDFSGKIVFIEEIGESTYRIDRMLTQLLNADKFKNCAGVALGVFYDCDSKAGDTSSIPLIEVLRDRLSSLNVPVAYGLPIGHIDDNATLPMGVSARLNADDVELKLLEAGVV